MSFPTLSSENGFISSKHDGKMPVIVHKGESMSDSWHC